MATRRTTVVAEAGDLDLLAREARARGLSLGRMLGEVVAEHADAVRSSRRPHVGTFEATFSIAEAATTADPAARPFRVTA